VPAGADLANLVDLMGFVLHFSTSGRLISVKTPVYHILITCVQSTAPVLPNHPIATQSMGSPPRTQS
jgi:hypothetical protein